MQVRTTLTGTKGSALLLNNGRLADPDDPIVQAIKAITDRGKQMTDVDRKEVARLSYHGAMYGNGDGPAIPAVNLRRCFQDAAKMTKKGKQIERALIPLSSEAAIDYKGPRDFAALWDSDKFIYRAMVRKGRGRVPSVRPSFRDWSLAVDWEMIETFLNLRDFKEIIDLAGVCIGLGDNRTNGFGRFTATVVKL